MTRQVPVQQVVEKVQYRDVKVEQPYDVVKEVPKYVDRPVERVEYRDQVVEKKVPYEVKYCRDQGGEADKSPQIGYQYNKPRNPFF